MSQSELESFWQKCLSSLPQTTLKPTDVYEAWHFSARPEVADELAELTRLGIKQATASLQWAYEVQGERLPEPGDFSVITDWEGHPVCLIQTDQVDIKPFNEVDEKFAFDEGEGDRSLAYWRRVHWECFSEECALIGRVPAEDMPVVCERFHLVFPRP